MDMPVQERVVAPTWRTGGSQHPLSTGFMPDQGAERVNLSPTIVPSLVGLEGLNSTGDGLQTDSHSLGQQKTRLAEVRLPPREAIFFRTDEDPRTVPIQLWEGRVIDVNKKSGTMNVYLAAKIVQTPDHTAEIQLKWVHPQDAELVRPGAIFYLTLYKEIKRSSISNSQELRFRRLPSWSKSQIERIKLEAARLLARAKEKPQAG